jgi:ubiquinone/menaquinone biosynthesis C-methylase UbiE
MATMMESKLSARQHALLKKVLVAQTESLGRVETPIVEDLLGKGRCRTVLDIGCGEGSFLLQLAERVKGARFLGIDHNELAIRDALRRLRRRPQRNVKFGTAFFDSNFERDRYDAILTRYTIQHSSHPQDFVQAVFDRLKKKGLFVALESLDAYTDCHDPDPIWERFRISVGEIHKKIGSNADTGKSLGLLLKAAGFRDIQVRIVLCSPSTVGWARFRAVVQASAELAFSFFPDLFDAALLDDLKAWLNNRARLEEKDPYFCSAVANGTRP